MNVLHAKKRIGPLLALAFLQFYWPSNSNFVESLSTFQELPFCKSNRHVHLSVGHDPSTSMTISFSSRIDDCGDLAWNGQRTGGVLIGTKPSNLSYFVPEKEPAKWYNATGKRGLYVSDFFHHVEVDGLFPSATYYFQPVIFNAAYIKTIRTRENIRSGGVDIGKGNLNHIKMEPSHSDELEEKNRFLRHRGRYIEKDTGISSFTTAPPLGDRGVPVKFAIIGDVAMKKSSLDTIEHLSNQRNDLNLVMLVGDIAYANSNHNIWDKWFDAIGRFPFLSEKPLQVAPGNHEVDRDKNTGEIFVSYESRFSMPKIKEVEKESYGFNIGLDTLPYPLPYDYGNAYYSFKYGLSHNIMLSSYSSMHPTSKQHAWLSSELASINRTLTPWVTVTIHCPLYNTFTQHRKDKQSIEARKYLEPLFVRHHVNLVFSGHLHAYMRTKPVAFGSVHKKGPVHIILGDGGRNANSPYHSEIPESWVDIRDHKTFGYGTVEFVNASHASYEWVQTAVNQDGETLSTANVSINHLHDVAGTKDSIYIQNQFLFK